MKINVLARRFYLHRSVTETPLLVSVNHLAELLYLLQIFITNEIISWKEKEKGPGSSVGIATGYGLGGSGIESRWGRDFPHLS